MFKKTTLFATFVIATLFTFTTIANSQGVSASKGRSNAMVLEYNGDNYRAIKKIRDLINEGKYESAASRSIKIIKNSEANERIGIDKSVIVREAYNSLCVSSTALRKVEYALNACNNSLSYSPDHWESLKSRATLYFLTEDYNNSLIDFQSALENSPADNISDVLKQNISVVRSKIN
ncbi:MAG: tetratricopeptide repeat protein [Emcibacteraceae bacterium]|nr:tetratricopeptide repeat protein [Emcibacteraceae bacterium]